VRRLIVAGATILAACYPALAADPAANFVVKLFMDVCIPNIGQPANVRTWAEQHHLLVMTNPAALEVFLGKGDKGAAWEVPAKLGNFALSIRGTTEACAVWARGADPEAVQSLFKAIIEGVKRPGIDVNTEQDTRVPSQFGSAHALVYSITGPSRPNGFLFTLLTAERAGAGFQVSLQSAVGKKP
jgi:hypothetical protein